VKGKYPYLAYWKECSLKTFPKTPPDVILDQERECFKGVLPAATGTGILSKLLLQRSIQDRAELEQKRLGAWVQNLQDASVNKEIPRRQILTLFGKALPSFKSGRAIPNYARRDLAKCYKELMFCIKEIREKLAVPLTRTSEDEWPARETAEDIKNAFPEVLSFFDDQELPRILEQSSISKTALKIIRLRLKRFGFTERTLRDTLYKVKD
jgi:hypothetical protein